MSSYQTRIERLEVKFGNVRFRRTPYTPPEMTEADIVIYFDEMRLPEKVADLERCLSRLTPEARATEILKSTIQRWESELTYCRDYLAILARAYEAGEMSTEDYTRLTTPQEYSHKHILKMRMHINRFIPSRMGTSAGGTPVFTLTDAQGGTIYLRREGERWIRDDVDPFGY